MDGVSTSYFYNVRFLKPWQIPISTAVWDPKWFHAFKGQSHKFIDKNGVLNGVRAEFLHPDSTCQDLCRGLETCEVKDPSKCAFIKAYKIQLSKIDKEELAARIASFREKMKNVLKLDRLPELVFLVHEPPYKACSERAALQDLLECQELEVKKKKT